LATPSLTKITPARQAQSPQAQIADSSSMNAASFSSDASLETVNRDQKRV
jgi:hypothetical protein